MSDTLFDTAEFQQALYNEGKDAFQAIMQQHGDDLYVIGLYHFGNFDALMPMFNTCTALKEVQDQAAEGSTGDDNVFIRCSVKWNPSDYPMLETYSGHFEKTEQALRKLKATMETRQDACDQELQRGWQQLLSAMEQVLRRLDRDGVFLTDVGRQNLVVSIATYDELEAIQFERIKRLNPRPVVDSIRDEFEILISTREKIEKAALTQLQFNNDS